ncbi:hypothetical protein [Helicobacter sp.]|uniref:hypothetical protein n=1 Tax=Helicobacter sp. TaxID=218 RepID=UPI00388E6520
MSWRDIQDRAIVSMSIVLGALVFVGILALLSYLAWQGYACVQEWRMPKSFIEFLGILALLKLIIDLVIICFYLRFK